MGIVKNISRWIRQFDISIYWKFVFSYVILFLFTFLVMVLFVMPPAIEVARKIDKDRCDNLMRSVQVYMDNILENLAETKEKVEFSVWFNDLFFKKIVQNKEMSPTETNIIKKDLIHLTEQKRVFSLVSVMLYEDDTLYNATTIIPSYQSYSTYGADSSIHSRFFMLNENEGTGLYRVWYGENNKYSALVYRSRITNRLVGNLTNRPKGELNVFLDIPMMEKDLSYILKEDATGFRLYDSARSELFALSLSSDSPQKASVTLKYSSADGNYYYELDIPQPIANQNEVRMQKILLVISIGNALLSLVLAFYFSLQNYKPIRVLVQQLGYRDKHLKNEFTVLGEKLHLLVNTQSELESIKPQIRQKYIMNILNGTLRDEKDSNKLQYYGIDFRYQYYCVLSAQIPLSRYFTVKSPNEDMLAQANLALEATVQYLLEGLDAVGYIFSPELDRYDIILNYHTVAQLKEFVFKLAQDCSTFFSMTSEASSLYFGVGDTVLSYDQLYISAHHAAEALNHSIMNQGGTVIYYDNLERNPSLVYYYPITEEVSIINALGSGNASAACEVLNRVFRENLVNTNLDPVAARCLYFDLLSTLLKAIGALGFTQKEFFNLQKIEKLGNLYEMKDYFEEVFQRICRTVNAKRYKKNPGVEQQILEYIEQNLYNPELSLTSIAEHFHVSVSYVSMTFKNLTGVPYSEYVNQARIKKAVSFLENSDLTMDEIIRSVGYISASTFRRNFIKYAKQRPVTAHRPVPNDTRTKG